MGFLKALFKSSAAVIMTGELKRKDKPRFKLQTSKFCWIISKASFSWLNLGVLPRVWSKRLILVINLYKQLEEDHRTAHESQPHFNSSYNRSQCPTWEVVSPLTSTLHIGTYAVSVEIWTTLSVTRLLVHCIYQKWKYPQTYQKLRDHVKSQDDDVVYIEFQPWRFGCCITEF